METFTAPKYKDFAPLLQQREIPFREKDHWLTVGKPDTCNQWILYVSCCVHLAPQLVEAVLPVLKARNLPFRVLKDQQTTDQMNGGWIDVKEAGKVITVYPGAEAVAVAKELEAVTSRYMGPGIPECLRIGKVVYAVYNEVTNAGIPGAKRIEKSIIPPASRIPFKIRRRYRPAGKWSKIITVLRTRELPQTEITAHFKGTVWKGTHLGSLTHSLLKWGYECAAGDMYGRTIWDRFAWQMEVLKDLYRSGVPVPKPRKLYKAKGGCGLSMQLIDGEKLGDVIRALLKGKKWKDTPVPIRAKIIGYYKEVLRIIQMVHQKGYVFRDISHINFMIDRQDKMYLLDPEISYSRKKRKPAPAFMLGTKGYYAPEQPGELSPDYSQDLYALGALLSFCFTGENPNNTILSNRNRTRKNFVALTNDSALVDMVMKCTQENPEDRPKLEALITGIGELEEGNRITGNIYKKAI